MTIQDLFYSLKKYGFVQDGDFNESDVKRDSNGQFAKQNEKKENFEITKTQKAGTEYFIFRTEKKDKNGNTVNIQIDSQKLQGYSLNKNHTVGKHKAIQFEKVLGYTQENYEELIEKVFNAFDNEKLIEQGDKGFGMTYKQTIEILGKNGKSANVRVGWIGSEQGKRLTTIFIEKE